MSKVGNRGCTVCGHGVGAGVGGLLVGVCVGRRVGMFDGSWVGLNDGSGVGI